MSEHLTHKQLDQIAKNLLRDFSLDAETINEIAESPKLWWSLRNKIATEKSQRQKQWFFGIHWRSLAFSAATLALCIGVLGLVFFVNQDKPTVEPENNAVKNIDESPIEKPVVTIAKVPDEVDSAPVPKVYAVSSPKKTSVKPIPAAALIKPNVNKIEPIERKRNIQMTLAQASKPFKKDVLPETAKEETKTDFIALSYASNSESGQIVRVKVPRSMMVSLGVSNNVSKNYEMVNAEVIIDDDGSTRAIRFISKR